MELEDSQKLATGSYPKIDDSSPFYPILIF
jgi:hypothetical protein